MRHCDNIEDIRRIQNERVRMSQLRIRRVSIASWINYTFEYFNDIKIR